VPKEPDPSTCIKWMLRVGSAAAALSNGVGAMEAVMGSEEPSDVMVPSVAAVSPETSEAGVWVRKQRLARVT
jgi:hypothetical protein